MPEQLKISQYNDLRWITRITDETTAYKIAQQAFREFRDRIYTKYIPLYAEANTITGATQRLVAQRRLRAQMQAEIDRFFLDYQRTSLDSLNNAKLANARLQYQFLADDVERRAVSTKRAKVAEMQARQERAPLQLGDPRSTADPRDVKGRHYGKRQHVVNKLVAGLDREARKIGRTTNEQQFVRTTRRWVETVARTEALATISVAEKQAISESFEKYRYVAVEDDATTERCLSLNGQIFSADEVGSVIPPQHFNCRAEVSPVTTDAARDKELASLAQQKFDTWLKKQPPGTQELIVGKENMSDYRAGKYQPPPRWKEERAYFVDERTGLPVVRTKENRDRIARRTKLVDVEFAA